MPLMATGATVPGLYLHICHAWQRWPLFPVNLCELVSLRLEGMQAKYSAGVLR